MTTPRLLPQFEVSTGWFWRYWLFGTSAVLVVLIIGAPLSFLLKLLVLSAALLLSWLEQVPEWRRNSQVQAVAASSAQSWQIRLPVGIRSAQLLPEVVCLKKLIILRLRVRQDAQIYTIIIWRSAVTTEVWRCLQVYCRFVVS